MVDYNFITDKENNYSLYNFEDFDMLRDEKLSFLPDFALLTEMEDYDDRNLGKGADLDEFMECQNINEVTTTIDTDAIKYEIATTDARELNVTTVVDVVTSVEPDSASISVPTTPSHDEKTVAAVLASWESNSMTPLIKEGLRSTIQSKRLREGKEELKVRFTPYIKREPETEEEVERALKRKEQNKMAARRFRQKQKDSGDHFLKKIKKIEAANVQLREEILKLRKDKEELDGILRDHLAVCQYKPVVNFP